VFETTEKSIKTQAGVPGCPFQWSRNTGRDQHLNCDFVIVNTAGKDLGTIFEAGFSYAYKKPIIYYFKAPDGVNFNLMLAHSGVAVAKNKQQLIDILNQLKNNEFDFSKLEKYKGNIE
jgi:nucleoside 2-deoxyribosyltransferase